MKVMKVIVRRVRKIISRKNNLKRRRVELGVKKKVSLEN
jgi:hypothetical protein